MEELENRGILLKRTAEKFINQKGAFLGSLMRVYLTLMENLLTLLAKNVLLPLGVRAAVLATDAAIQKKIYVYS